MTNLITKTVIETVTYSSQDYDSMGNHRDIPEISGYGTQIAVDIQVEGRNLCTVKIGDNKFMEQQLIDLLNLMKATKAANRTLLSCYKETLYIDN